MNCEAMTEDQRDQQTADIAVSMAFRAWVDQLADGKTEPEEEQSIKEFADVNGSPMNAPVVLMYRAFRAGFGAGMDLVTGILKE